MRLLRVKCLHCGPKQVMRTSLEASSVLVSPEAFLFVLHIFNIYLSLVEG